MVNKKKRKSNLQLKAMQKSWQKIQFRPNFINQPAINAFTKVTAWLDTQYNLENLRLLADIAAQEKPLLLNTNLRIEEINNLTDVEPTNSSNLSQKNWKLLTT